MNKKTIFSFAITLSFSFGIISAANAMAEEGIMPISETDSTVSNDEPVEGTINLDDLDEIDTPTTPIDSETDTTFDENTNDLDLEDNSNAENDILHNGTSGEPEVVCASTDEPGCEDEAIDPEMWPLYISLGALGATILLVIIINLIGHRKK